MRKAPPIAAPDAYVEQLSGWQRGRVEALRAVVRGDTRLDERIRWGHLVYFCNGPVLLIRAEESRVLFGFWRGQRLRGIEPRLKPGGKFELATIVLLEHDTMPSEQARRLVSAAVELNLIVGNPTAPSGAG